MKCPTCKVTVSDDAAVCPHCDTVLDPSLLDASPPPDDEVRTDESAVPPSRSRPARPGRAPSTSRSGAAPKKKKRRVRPPVQADAPKAAKRDWREDVSAEDWNQMPQGPREQFIVDRGLDPDDVLGEARQFVYGLSSADKLAFFGSAAMFLACFFPWKETVSQGEVLGMMSLGVVVFILSGVAMAAIGIRARRSFGDLSPVLPWAAQLACLGFGEMWCLVYMKLSWDSTLARPSYGTVDVWVSKPSFGVILALLSGVVALLGTLTGLKDLGARR